MSDDLCDDSDIKWQVRCVCTKGNLLVKAFKQCTDDVKIKLFTVLIFMVHIVA